MYAPESQKGIRLTMASLEGELGKKVFTEIRSAKAKDTGKTIAAQVRQRIKAAERR